VLVVLAFLPGLTSGLHRYIVALTLFPSIAFSTRQSCGWDLIFGTANEVRHRIENSLSCELTCTGSSFVNIQHPVLASRLSSSAQQHSTVTSVAFRNLLFAIGRRRWRWVLVARRRCEDPMGQRPTSPWCLSTRTSLVPSDWL
jgi:hypothetical protein